MPQTSRKERSKTETATGQYSASVLVVASGDRVLQPAVLMAVSSISWSTGKVRAKNRHTKAEDQGQSVWGS